MNKKNYKSTIDNIQFSEDLNEKTLNYLSAQSSQPQYKLSIRKVKRKRKYTVFATVVCVVALIMIPMFIFRSDFKLNNAVGLVSVKYIDKAPSISSSSILVGLTEEEIFHKWNTDIFMGEIEEIKNIKVSFNGFIDYRAIVKISINKVYRGTGTTGEVVFCYSEITGDS